MVYKGFGCWGSVSNGGSASFLSVSAAATVDVEGETPYGREPHIPLRYQRASPALPEPRFGTEPVVEVENGDFSAIVQKIFPVLLGTGQMKKVR